MSKFKLTKTSGVPKGDFYAIMTPNSTLIRGTYPGMGDKESTSWNIEVFTNKKEWEDEIKNKIGMDFKAVKMTPAQVTQTITITDETEEDQGGRIEDF